MVMSALESFMTKVAWAPLDVLVIDMPPGTGVPFICLIVLLNETFQRHSCCGLVVVALQKVMACWHL